MLLRLMRTYLRPYRRWLAVIVVLQFAATIASLFLPTLNADIIDNGVATGDTGYIAPDGRRDARDLADPDRCARSSPCTSAPAPRWRSGATCAARSSTRSARSPAREVAQFGAPSLITRTTNDVQQVQMLVADDLHDDGHRRRS